MSITTAVLTERIEQFRELQRRLKLANIEDDKVFQSLIRDAQVLLEMSDSEIANSLSVSRPTLNRWMNGRTSPHLAIKKSAVGWMGDQVASKVRKLEASAKCASQGSSSPWGYEGGRMVAKGCGSY